MASEKMKTQYDARATGNNFHEDDKAWLWNLKCCKGLSLKLLTNWEGSYTVLKRMNNRCGSDTEITTLTPEVKNKEEKSTPRQKQNSDQCWQLKIAANDQRFSEKANRNNSKRKGAESATVKIPMGLNGCHEKRQQYSTMGVKKNSR
ncbi:hypothetical protein TNCV_5018651 [Trichonephila clavipes]|nr:hypothetical protein TNCV_5018651 [Trichonephila clavipes]